MPDIGPFLCVSVAGVDGSVDVAVTGELEILAGPRFVEAVVQAANARPGRISLDLSGVEFLDSSGISALLLARQQLEDTGSSMTITTVSPAVRQVIGITGLTELLGGPWP